MIPYGHQSMDNDDIQAVMGVLKSDFLTQGSKVDEFEKKLAEYCGSKYAVVVSNGTAALHSAYVAAGLKSGDEFITSSITFPATSNAGLWQGAKPVFVDIDSETGNINVDLIEEKINEKTRAIVPIDYTGRPVDLVKIEQLADKYNLTVIEDACQALGAVYKGKKIGSVSDLTVFSFHPVKTITTGEGGAILTNNEKYYKILKKFITHGITKEDFIYESPGDWYFEMQMLGMNYRLTDLQCALGISQLKKVDNFVDQRRELVSRYNEAFKNLDIIDLPVEDTDEVQSAWHLYVVRLKENLVSHRSSIVRRLRTEGVGAQIHHIPTHLHPYYQQLGYKKGCLPVTENFYERIISLPLYPGLKENQQDFVVKKFIEITKEFI